jgi:hypothetical protein
MDRNKLQLCDRLLSPLAPRLGKVVKLSSLFCDCQSPHRVLYVENLAYSFENVFGLLMFVPLSRGVMLHYGLLQFLATSSSKVLGIIWQVT